MNTPEKGVAAGLGEATEIEEREQIRLADLQWVQRWRDGSERCPQCGGIEFGLPDAVCEDQAR
jgi:hypothetical protein